MNEENVNTFVGRVGPVVKYSLGRAALPPTDPSVPLSQSFSKLALFTKNMVVVVVDVDLLDQTKRGQHNKKKKGEKNNI